jgi:probable rRNA maturation factor
MTPEIATPEVEVLVSVEDPAWAARSPDCRETARVAAVAAIRAALPAAVGLPGGRAMEASVVLADDAMVRALNRTYRGKDSPTNVLSFPAFGDADVIPPGDEPLPLGDVIVALGVAEREAGAQGKTLAHHLSHLVVHGMLHLLEQDHETEADARRMEALEVEILAALGVADPYAAAEAQGTDAME